LMLSRLFESKKYFEKVINLYPNNPEVAQGYGKLLLKLNQHNEGLKYIKKGTKFIRFTEKNYKII